MTKIGIMVGAKHLPGAVSRVNRRNAVTAEFVNSRHWHNEDSPYDVIVDRISRIYYRTFLPLVRQLGDRPATPSGGRVGRQAVRRTLCKRLSIAHARRAAVARLYRGIDHRESLRNLNDRSWELCLLRRRSS
jgi:hypothetical protein